MKFLSRVVVILVLTVALGAPANAQTARGPSRFDIGVYAGGSWTTDWLEGKGYEFGIGYNPVFGGFATLWATPHLGFRTHGAYIPSKYPRSDRLNDSEIYGDRPLNLWLYDLDLMYRPFATRPGVSPRLSSVYLFVGGGALTADPAGEDGERCVYPYDLAEACLSHDPSRSTVGQATAGAGMTLLPLTDRFGLFGELAVHGYDSPFHIQPDDPTLDQEDICEGTCHLEDGGLALTPRLVLGARLGLGGAAPALALAAPVVPLPAVPAAPAVPPAPPPPPARAIQLCVMEGSVPQYVEARVRPATGDTVIVTAAGVERPLRAVFPAPPETAAGLAWHANNEDIFYMGRPYLRFGVPVAGEPGALAPIGAFQGIPLYARTGAESPPQEILIPVGDGCEMQPYQVGDLVRRVRG